jgi:cell division transport system permease protein
MQAIRDTWTHIRRSPYHSSAAVLTMFLTMLLAGLFLLTTVGSSLILNYFESKPQITVFFSDSATPTDASSLQQTLEATGKVSSVNYVSKEDALIIYREQNKSDPLLLEMVTADILPASLEISAVDPNFLNELQPTITGAQGVEEVVFQKDVVDTLLTWTRAIRWVGGVLVGLFTFNSLLIVMTVIGMKIALKKEEIEILTLVGASPWYIRAPFFLEGGAYGATGALVSWFIIMGFMIWLQPVIMGFLGTVPFIGSLFSNLLSQTFLLFSLAFFLFMILAGFTLGGIGSLIALRRYLKF